MREILSSAPVSWHPPFSDKSCNKTSVVIVGDRGPKKVGLAFPINSLSCSASNPASRCSAFGMFTYKTRAMTNERTWMAMIETAMAMMPPWFVRTAARTAS